MVSLGRQVSKMERARSQQKKERLVKIYKDNHGIELSSRQVFFTKSDQIEEKLVRKMLTKRETAAVIRI